MKWVASRRCGRCVLGVGWGGWGRGVGAQVGEGGAGTRCCCCVKVRAQWGVGLRGMYLCVENIFCCVCLFYEIVKLLAKLTSIYDLVIY